MTKIDIIKIVGTLVSTILIPVILEWLKRRSENRMFSNEQLKLNLENAKEFKDIVLSTQDPLIRDRSAKKTFNNKNLTFNEVDFFSKFIDQDFWISEYLKVKTQLKIVRNESKKIIKFEQNFSNSDFWWNIFWYVLYFLLFSLPFVFIENSQKLFLRALHQEAYSVLFFSIIIFTALFLGIISTLSKGRKQTDAKKFLKKLKDSLIHTGNTT